MKMIRMKKLFAFALAATFAAGALQAMDFLTLAKPAEI